MDSPVLGYFFPKQRDTSSVQILYREYKLGHNEDGTATPVEWNVKGVAAECFGEMHDKFQTVLQTLYTNDQSERSGELLQNLQGEHLPASTRV